MAKHVAPTTQITTPVNGHVVTLKEWITGREAESVQAVFLAGTKVKPQANGTMEFGAIEVGDKTTEMTHRAVSVWVTAVDGVQESVLEDVLNMHEKDYAFVLAKIDVLAKKK